MNTPTSNKPVIKVESGIQLLTRLTRKSDIENFYPNLFHYGPKHGDVIELFGSVNTSFLVIDVITEAILPMKFGGSEAGILLIKTDSNMDFGVLIDFLKRKITTYMNKGTFICTENDCNDQLKANLHEALSNLYIMEIYDSIQLYTTIYNLENILVQHPNISLIVIDTLTAFYWSEQGFKITKMDMYIKNLLRIIQKHSKQYKISILYTRPEYFSSSKDSMQNLETCCELPTLEKFNYQIQLLPIKEGYFLVHIKTHNNIYTKSFQIFGNEIKWVCSN